MKKILLIVLGSFYTLAIVATVALCIHFWSYISAVDFSLITPSNIKALYQGLTEAPEVTAEKKKQLDSERSNEIKEYINIDIREYTEEEKKQIESGEKTETEILAQIITETVEKNNTETNGENDGEVSNENDVKPEGEKVDNNEVKVPVVNDNKKAEEPQVPRETAEQIVARYVSQLYAIQGEFEGRISALASSVKNWTAAYYRSHPGIRYREAKVAAVEYFSGTASGIERECYARVDAQMAQLKKDLEAIGADTSIVETVKSTAYAEMENRKAQIVQEGYAELAK